MIGTTIALLLSLTNSAQVVLGEQYTEKFRLAKAAEANQLQVKYEINDFPANACNSPQCSFELEEDKAHLNVHLNLDRDKKLIGHLTIYVSNNGEDVATSEIRDVIPPKPKIDTISTPKDIVWNGEESIDFKISGSDFFNPDVFISKLYSGYSVTSSSSNAITIKIPASSMIFPGNKNVTIRNPGGYSEVIKCNLIFAIKPSVSKSENKRQLISGIGCTAKLNLTGAKNIKAIFVGTKDRKAVSTSNVSINTNFDDDNTITLLTSDASKALESYLFAITKNITPDTVPLCQVSDHFENAITAKKTFIRKTLYDGELIDKIFISQADAPSYIANNTCTISIPGIDKKTNCTYQKDEGIFHLNDALSAERRLSGQWKITYGSSEFIGDVIVKKFPTILNMTFTPSNEGMSKFIDRIFIMPTPLAYSAEIVFDGEYDNFPLNPFAFLDPTISIKGNPILLNRSPNSSTFTFKFTVPNTLAEGEYFIKDSTTNRILYRSLVKKYESPDFSMDLVRIKAGDATYEKFITQREKRINLKFSESLNRAKGITISLNNSGSQSSIAESQHLMIQATLYDDKGRKLDNVNAAIDSKQKSVNVDFDVEEIKEWYSIDLAISAQLEKYTPNQVGNYSQESLIQHKILIFEPEDGSRLSSAFDVTFPVQQTVLLYNGSVGKLIKHFEFDGDTKASLFNVGVNKIWRKRQKGFEQTRTEPLHYGFGAYFSNLDNIEKDHYLAMGGTFILGYSFEKIDFSLGIGPAFEYNEKIRKYCAIQYQIRIK